MPARVDHWAIACSYMTSDVLKTEEFRKLWVDWVDHRKELKKSLTSQAIKRQIKKLERWGYKRAITALDHTMEGNWVGIREPEKPEQRPVQPSESLDERRARELREAEEWWDTLLPGNQARHEVAMKRLLEEDHPERWQQYVDDWKKSGEWVQHIYDNKGRFR